LDCIKSILVSEVKYCGVKGLKEMGEYWEFMWCARDYREELEISLWIGPRTFCPSCCLLPHSPPTPVELEA